MIDEVMTSDTRARILQATMDLLASDGRMGVSTRAVSAAAGIQPQTIYRQFGDMDGLLAATAHEGFRRYLSSKSARPRRADPLDDLRDGWDLHIEFGVQHPALYLLMYGNPDRVSPSAAEADAAALLTGLVEAIARAGRLRLDLQTAVAMIQSTGIGVVLTLINAGDAQGALSDLSERVREAVLEAIALPAGETFAVANRADVVAAYASALRATHPHPSLSAGEALLLDELLTRISAKS